MPTLFFNAATAGIGARWIAVLLSVTLPAMALHRGFASVNGRSGDRCTEKEDLRAHRTRLFFSSTAGSAGGGSLEVGIHELVVPYVETGLTDHLTLSGGFSLIPGSDRQYYFGSSKFTILSSALFDLGAGLSCFGERGGAAVSRAFANTTIRGDGGEFTIGLGWTITGEAEQLGAAVSVGAAFPLGGRVDIITDNLFPGKSGPSLLSIGIRIRGRPFSAEIGLLHPRRTEGGLFPLFPWLSFAYLI